MSSLLTECAEFYHRTVQEVKLLRPRQIMLQIINLGLIVSSALMIWKTLMVVTNSESPVVVVLSGSMEPGFERGDILFLSMGAEAFRPGDITVFKITGREVPIVHRVIKVHDRTDYTTEVDIDVLTKGDNNRMDDRGLYARGQQFLTSQDIVGRARGIIPYVGMVTIWMNDYPSAKIILIGVLALAVLLSKE
eukprot:TRINITY_DN4425_c0_g1::TRINITY_DN4425_c0_g1_i1::g.7377::m.7377 TRINITY_DN4425_c0_g1::TRINITY_DN4425_c0_g1_i1::g.7377  ORF type:complete len:192 (-),score=28.90,sp/Q5RC30/SC11C_PONAB/58.86/1e-66,Peptidase_S24/PF00717.18/2e-10 TRINITY_DN4425_c0_g1_i1:888-1463(-)